MSEEPTWIESARPCERRGCDNWITDPNYPYAWCEACQKKNCEHGHQPGDCDACMRESDLAYDEDQERRVFQ